MASSDPDAVLTFAGKDLVRLPAAAFAGIDTAVSVSFWAFGDASLPVSTSAFEAASAALESPAVHPDAAEGLRAIARRVAWRQS